MVSRRLGDYLAATLPGPVLVAQIETATTEDPLVDVLGDVDAAFVGTTDLALDLEWPANSTLP